MNIYEPAGRAREYSPREIEAKAKKEGQT